MAEYKVIFRTDIDHPDSQHPIAWEQGCPLMLEAIQISRDTESGRAFLQTKVRSLSGTTIPSFKAKLTCHYKDGSTEEFKIEPLDADIAPCGEYAPKPIALSRGDAVYAEAFVLSVGMSDKDWVSTATACPLPRRNPLALSADALNERISLLRERGSEKACEAAPYSYMERDGWSQCPCGQVSIGCRVCPSCGLRLSGIEETESEEFLKEAIEKRADRLEKAAEEKKQQEAKARVRTKKWAIIGGSAAAVLVCATLYFNWMLPDVIKLAASYSEALRLYEAKEYEAAYEAFDGLGDYRDAKQKAEETQTSLLDGRYTLAVKLLIEDKYDEAIEAFQELDGYKESAEKIEEAKRERSRSSRSEKIASSEFDSANASRQPQSDEDVGKDMAIVREYLAHVGESSDQIKSEYDIFENDSSYTNGWGMLKEYGALFGIDGYFGILYSKQSSEATSGNMTSVAFKWNTNDADKDKDHVIGCLSQYFGDDYESSDLSKTVGKPTRSYKWSETPQDEWSVYFVIDEDGGSVQFTELR